MVTGPATAAQGTDAALSGTSRELHVTNSYSPGYGRFDGWTGPAPDLPSHRLARLARRPRVAARRPRQSEAAAERLSGPGSAPSPGQRGRGAPPQRPERARGGAGVDELMPHAERAQLSVPRSDVTALRGDELHTSLQRLVQPGPLALEESGWVHTFGLCLGDESVGNHGTGSGLTSEDRTHLSGTAGVLIRRGR